MWWRSALSGGKPIHTKTSKTSWLMATKETFVQGVLFCLNDVWGFWHWKTQRFWAKTSIPKSQYRRWDMAGSSRDKKSKHTTDWHERVAQNPS